MLRLKPHRCVTVSSPAPVVLSCTKAADIAHCSTASFSLWVSLCPQDYTRTLCQETAEADAESDAALQEAQVVSSSAAGLCSSPVTLITLLFAALSSHLH